MPNLAAAINADCPYNRPCPVAMNGQILQMWKLALTSDSFQKVIHYPRIEKTSNVLKSVEGAYSPVGVLCELYCLHEQANYWVETRFGMEWRGIHLSKCPDEVIFWAFRPNMEEGQLQELRDYLFYFDSYFDRRRNFPSAKYLQRVFGGKWKGLKVRESEPKKETTHHLKTRAYLESKGWRYITSRQLQYSRVHYYDHDDYPRDDGRWYTQGDAVIEQKAREWKERTSYLNA